MSDDTAHDCFPLLFVADVAGGCGFHRRGSRPLTPGVWWPLTNQYMSTDIYALYITPVSITMDPHPRWEYTSQPVLYPPTTVVIAATPHC